LLCLRNARAFPLLPAALASVPFGFVLVRVRVPMARNARAYTSARSIGFCVIWVCISSSFESIVLGNSVNKYIWECPRLRSGIRGDWASKNGIIFDDCRWLVG